MISCGRITIRARLCQIQNCISVRSWMAVCTAFCLMVHPWTNQNHGIGGRHGMERILELNRMAFDDYLPRNAESYCIGKTLRLIKKRAPHIKWVISFADGCQCGDGTIYRASNFILTGIRKTRPSWNFHRVTLSPPWHWKIHPTPRLCVNNRNFGHPAQISHSFRMGEIGCKIHSWFYVALCLFPG